MNLGKGHAEYVQNMESIHAWGAKQEFWLKPSGGQKEREREKFLLKIATLDITWRVDTRHRSIPTYNMMGLTTTQYPIIHSVYSLQFSSARFVGQQSQLIVVGVKSSLDIGHLVTEWVENGGKHRQLTGLAIWEGSFVCGVSFMGRDWKVLWELPVMLELKPWLFEANPCWEKA